MKKEIVTSVDPKSPVSEVFRTLRTNLQYINKNDGAQTILLTSTIQGEGKSFVAGNLAVTFAQADKRVIIIDTDMRRPRQHKMFNTDMYPGLSNFLSGVNVNRSSHKIELDECIYKTKVNNLSLMPAGNIPPNPSELLQSDKLEELIEKLKENFDVIIFDGPPTLLVTDAPIVSRMVDATILVVSQKKTKIEDLKEVTNRIRRVGGKIAGVVLNNVEVSAKKYSEKYYYASTNDNLPAKTKSNKSTSSKRYYRTKDDKDVYKLSNTEKETKKSEEVKEITTSAKEEIKQSVKSRSVEMKEVTPDSIKKILEQINKLKEDNK